MGTPTKKVCPKCGDELWAFHLPAHLARVHGMAPEAKPAAPRVEPTVRPSAPADPHESAAGEGAESPPAAVPESVETPPRKPGLLDRIRSRRGRARGGQHRRPVAGERPPRPARPKGGGKRVPLDSDISDLWAFAGRRLERTAHYPTGRMLAYQAPAAGVILDRAITGTLPDRILFQPLARNRSKYEDAAFLLGGPMLTFSITTTMGQMRAAIEANDKDAFDAAARRLEIQREIFTWLLRAMLPRLAVGKKLAEEKKAKEDKLIAEAFPDLGEDDPAEVLAAMLFVPPTFEEASQNGKAPDPAPAPDREGPVSV